MTSWYITKDLIIKSSLKKDVNDNLKKDVYYQTYKEAVKALALLSS